MRASDQIEFIHALRGVASLLVLWVHVVGATVHALGGNWPVYKLWVDCVVKPLRLFQDGGHLGVVLFFLISGYVITHVASRESMSEFAVKRLFRLAPLLIVAIVSMATVSDVVGYAAVEPAWISQSSGLADAALNVTGASWLIGSPYVLAVTWSLFAESIFYCLVAVTLRRGQAGRSQEWATLGMLVASAALFLPFKAGLPAGRHYLEIIVYLPILIAGRAMYRKRCPGPTFRLIEGGGLMPSHERSI